MIEKLSLEQFVEIKKQLATIRDNIDELDRKRKELHAAYEYDEEYEKTLEKYVEEYFNIQSRLLNYDLSAIPFDAWEGLMILSSDEYIIDFSKSKANIDFGLAEDYIYGDFHGCNLRNLDKVKGLLNPQYFDEEVIKIYPSLFLSELFSEEFKNKFYNKKIDFADLAALSSEQIEEIKQKNFNLGNILPSKYKYMLEMLGLDKMLGLYKYSPTEFDAINRIVRIVRYGTVDKITLKDFLENVEITELKKACFEFARKDIINSIFSVRVGDYPKMFIKENPDLFLEDVNIPDSVKKRYYDKELTIMDLLDYPEEFRNIYIESFMEDGPSCISKFIRDNYGVGQFYELVQKYPEVFKHVAHNGFIFAKFLKPSKDLDRAFRIAVKNYFLNHEMPADFRTIGDNQIVYNVPDWLLAMNFKFVDRLKTKEDLMEYTDFVVVLDKGQNQVLDAFNIDNIKRFEQETGFFTHKPYHWSRDLTIFNSIGDVLKQYPLSSFPAEINFKNGSLTYEEFLNQMAKFLNCIRSINTADEKIDYSFLQGEFREAHPEIFIDESAPEELKRVFYKQGNMLDIKFLFQHKEYVPYLIDKDLANIIKAFVALYVPGLADRQGNVVPTYLNFINEYVSRYGNEKFLALIAKYGEFLQEITITSFYNEIDDEQAIEYQIRKAIYNKIVNLKQNIDYSYLANIPEMVKEYPEIFVNFDSLTNISQNAREHLSWAFYRKLLDCDYIKKYPDLISVLKDKNLLIVLGCSSDLKQLIKRLGNEKFLQFCSVYGRYLDEIGYYLNNDNLDSLTFEEIANKIESIIIRETKFGNINYKLDAPSFLKKKCPELFLSDDAPVELKNSFYDYTQPLTFLLLHAHKEWLPYLKDKAVLTSLLRCSELKPGLIKFVELFGEEKAIKLGIQRAETVTEIIRSHQVDLMKAWYDKTGGKFIPDYVVMENFALEEADKFLASGVNWSKLMKIQSFAANPEARDAMLRLAYSFGAFDQDQAGFKKLIELLTGIPKKISASYAQTMERIRSNDYPELEKALIEENFPFDLESKILEQIYRKNADGTYSLTINPQSYPKSSKVIRNIMENVLGLPVLSPLTAHRYLGDFILEYNPNFREFFLANYDAIFSNYNYLNQVSAIQRDFKTIKAKYSNVNLTLDLVLSYLDTHRFRNINGGNFKVAEVAAIQNFSQGEMEILQKIFNYAKQRVFSTIPRVEAKEMVKLPSGEYHYEILRLDDPRAMSVGFESNCCQRLHGAAQSCMEHSMLDGRVFIITNKEGELVAQSWVWRNKDVLCFDNIEVPDKQMWKNGIPRWQEDFGIRNQFTDDILAIYKMAASDLMAEDERVYRELLESGKITQEQYDGLRLGKITTGLGFSNIKGSLETLPVDEGPISRPLPYESPVLLSDGLYTHDSETQFIIEERNDRKAHVGKALPIHHDTYMEYTDADFTESDLLNLESLELATKKDREYSNINININDHGDKGHMVTNIAKKYGLNPNITRIVMNPNFAIIYEATDDEVRIADLFYNTKVDNNEQQMDIEKPMMLQMRLALDQIASGKRVDIASLSQEQIEMYTRVMNLDEELDIERGVGHAR